MRMGVLLLVGIGWALLGLSCLPLVDETDREPNRGRQLAIALTSQDVDQTISAGRPVRIEWAAANLTTSPARITILLESRTDLSRRTLSGPFDFTTQGGSGNISWDTTADRGPYRILARITAGAEVHEFTSTGLITIDGPATFDFTAPDGEITFQPDLDPPLTIAWFGGDIDAQVRIGLDPDTNHDSGNEIFIRNVTLTFPPAAGSFGWNGRNLAGTVVPSGTYNLFAVIAEDDAEDQFVLGLAVITIP